MSHPTAPSERHELLVSVEGPRQPCGFCRGVVEPKPGPERWDMRRDETYSCDWYQYGYVLVESNQRDGVHLSRIQCRLMLHRQFNFYKHAHGDHVTHSLHHDDYFELPSCVEDKMVHLVDSNSGRETREGRARALAGTGGWGRRWGQR
jgi:hypothetical protein